MTDPPIYMDVPRTRFGGAAASEPGVTVRALIEVPRPPQVSKMGPFMVGAWSVSFQVFLVSGRLSDLPGPILRLVFPWLLGGVSVDKLVCSIVVSVSSCNSNRRFVRVLPLYVGCASNQGAAAKPKGNLGSIRRVGL